MNLHSYLLLSVMTVNFHKNKSRPDIEHDELLLSFMHSQSSAGDVGFR